LHPVLYIPRACQLVSCWTGFPSPRCPFGSSLRVREPGPRGSFSPCQPGRPWPSRLQRGWMRPAPGFARRPSPPFPPVTKLSRTTVTERTRLGRELNCAPNCPTDPTNFVLVFRSPQTLGVCGELMSNISATRGHPCMRICVCGSPRGDLSHIAGLTLGRSRSDFS
jgi:hypothetical protein